MRYRLRVIVSEPWWVYSALVDPGTCDRIIEHGLSLDQEAGRLRASGELEKRKTSIAWIREDWVYEAVEKYVYKANKDARWNFDLERMQSLQFGVYTDGGKYDWHFDMTGRTYDERDAVSPAFHGLLRKVSFSLQLSAPGDYEGGALELELGLPSDANRIEQPDPSRERGTLVVFPSFVPHRVTPVTSGTRYSLVGWVCGKPWR